MQDISDIGRLNAQLGYPEPKQTIALRFRRIRKDRRDHQIFVAVQNTLAARSNAVVIGWIHVFIDKLLTVGPRTEVGGLVVDDKSRSRGVGAALLLRAEQWTQEKGSSPLVVRTNVVRIEAHKFYEKCGYRLLKQSKVYIKELTRRTAIWIPLESQSTHSPHQ